jgi:hypothetical protein
MVSIWEISPQNSPPTIDTFLATMLFLLVLEAALLQAESASKIIKDSIVSSVISPWNRHSDN